MLEFKEALKILEESFEFKEWKKSNSKDYLSYALFVIQEGETDWKIGYCNEQNKITSFNVGEKITIEPDEEALQERKKKISGIDLEKLKLEMADAVTIAKNVQQEEFSSEKPIRIIVVLQKQEIGQVWNISLFTQSFNILNIKIKSDDGEVIEKKLQPLFNKI